MNCVTHWPYYSFYDEILLFLLFWIFLFLFFFLIWFDFFSFRFCFVLGLESCKGRGQKQEDREINGLGMHDVKSTENQ